MTTKITCLLALMPGFLWAQIQWEHTYDSPNLERRTLDPLAEIHQLDLSTLALQAGMYWIQLTDQRGRSLVTLKCILTR